MTEARFNLGNTLTVSKAHVKIKRLILVCIILLLSACSSHRELTDSQTTAAASITELTISSNDERMPGHIYQAAGDGPHPTAIMLHGYPGNEKNLDVAQAIRKAGWNALFFHYRGAWGAEGEFSFIGAEHDVQSVINYAQQADNAARLHIDPSKISLIGHSMGGHMAVAGILDNPSVNCAVAHDGANMGAGGKGLFSDKQSIKIWSDYSDSLFMLNGWSGKKAVAEISQFGQQLDLVPRAKKIDQRSVHLVAADTEVIPIEVHIKPLHTALSKHTKIASYELIDDDHSFSNSRDQLIASTINFLNKHCR